MHLVSLTVYAGCEILKRRQLRKLLLVSPVVSLIIIIPNNTLIQTRTHKTGLVPAQQAESSISVPSRMGPKASWPLAGEIVGTESVISS